ncbi:hypothetical protein ACGFYQ_00455 [Streptomyces sp. NPDC048258]|uniref:hypothetical protein n=1 Tax=Streptomyces sp. NPDC048258 TaxID=3365527 RepID=UPI0037190E32
MGIFDKLTGTKHPDSGVAPRSAEDVRAALFAVNGPDVAYVVRNAAPSERADLVAEWRITEPAWNTFFVRTQLTRSLRIKMRLVPENNEVRALDEQLDVTWVGGTPRVAISAEQSRGQVKTVSRRSTIERGEDGRLHKTEIFHFDTAQLKDPLREAVLGAGWTWRGAVFKL